MARFLDNGHAMDFLKRSILCNLRYARAAVQQEHDYTNHHLPSSVNVIRRREKYAEDYQKLFREFEALEDKMRALGMLA